MSPQGAKVMHHTKYIARVSVAGDRVTSSEASVSATSSAVCAEKSLDYVWCSALL